MDKFCKGRPGWFDSHTRVESQACIDQRFWCDNCMYDIAREQLEEFEADDYAVCKNKCIWHACFQIEE